MTGVELYLMTLRPGVYYLGNIVLTVQPGWIRGGVPSWTDVKFYKRGLEMEVVYGRWHHRKMRWVHKRHFSDQPREPMCPRVADQLTAFLREAVESLDD